MKLSEFARKSGLDLNAVISKLRHGIGYGDLSGDVASEPGDELDDDAERYIRRHFTVQDSTSGSTSSADSAPPVRDAYKGDEAEISPLPPMHIGPVVDLGFDSAAMKSEGVAAYRELLFRLVEGEKSDPETVRKVCFAAGVPVEHLQADAELLLSRRESVNELKRARELDRSAQPLREKYLAAKSNYAKRWAEVNEELKALDAQTVAASSSWLAVQEEAGALRSQHEFSLRQTCSPTIAVDLAAARKERTEILSRRAKVASDLWSSIKNYKYVFQPGDVIPTALDDQELLAEKEKIEASLKYTQQQGLPVADAPAARLAEIAAQINSRGPLREQLRLVNNELADCEARISRLEIGHRAWENAKLSITIAPVAVKRERPQDEEMITVDMRHPMDGVSQPSYARYS